MRLNRSVLLSVPLALLATVALGATHDVAVNDDMTFDPPNVTICLGDTVTWHWTGFLPHSVTSADPVVPCTANGIFDSGILFGPATFSHTFTTLPAQCATDDSPGDDTCSYVCTVHCPMMSGIVTINTDAPSGGVGISRSKLRISHIPTEGRGGTILGAIVLDGATFNDILADSTDLELEISGPGLGAPVSGTVHLDDVRSGYAGRFTTNDADPVSIGTVKIVVSSDPSLASLTLKYETNGFDLSTVGDLTGTVTVTQLIAGGPCGDATVTSSGSALIVK